MLLLTRVLYTPEATYGYLRHPGGMVLATVERPWADNEPDISCVPEGTYRLEPHDSERYPDTWALVNHDLGIAHYPTPGIPRCAILLHTANVADQLAGCIAPGLSFAHLHLAPHARALGVVQSTEAMRLLRRQLHRRAHRQLRIERLPWAV